MQIVSNRVRAAAASFGPVEQFYFSSRYAERKNEPGISDFTFGNPQEVQLLGLVDAIRSHAELRCLEDLTLRNKSRAGRYGIVTSGDATGMAVRHPSGRRDNADRDVRCSSRPPICKPG